MLTGEGLTSGPNDLIFNPARTDDLRLRTHRPSFLAMNVRIPTLQKMADGRFFTKWGGKRHFFGRDQAKAMVGYQASLDQWQAWNSEKDRARRSITSKRLKLIDIAEQFIETKRSEGGDNLARYYSKQLRRFLHLFGQDYADRIRAMDLLKLKAQMLAQHFAPKTINHDLVAIKAMLNWASGIELVPAANLRAAKVLPLPPVRVRALSHFEVLSFVHGAPEPMRYWLGTQYLTAARPTEMVRIAQGQGEWVADGVFRLDRGKMDLKTRMARHVIFSPLALSWLTRVEPTWARLDSYSQAVRDKCGAGGPHPLRHSAATHLILAGADRASVDLILGHAPTRVSLTYAQVDFRPLRPIAALLTL